MRRRKSARLQRRWRECVLSLTLGDRYKGVATIDGTMHKQTLLSLARNVECPRTRKKRQVQSTRREKSEERRVLLSRPTAAIYSDDEQNVTDIERVFSI